MLTMPDLDQQDSDDIDLEQLLKDVLVPLLEERDKQLKLYLDTRVEERVKNITPKADEATDEEGNAQISPEVKALRERIAAMEKRNQEEELAKKQQKLDSTLADIVQSFKSDEPKLAKLALQNHIGEIVEASDGSYMTKDGKKLEEVAGEFFNTPTGMRLLPATMRNGSGVPSGKPQRSNGKVDLTTDEALMQTFGSVI